MLALPTAGVCRSVQTHNVSVDVLADWIEASLLFADEAQVSTIDLIDALREGQIYDDRDMAAEIVGAGWTELRRRQSSIGSAWPFDILPNRVTRSRLWQDVPAHAFCVLLSLAKWYRSWAKEFGADYTEQGELFEIVTQKSIEAQFPGWKTVLTGWSRAQPRKLPKIVREIAMCLGEEEGKVERWAPSRANEAGLDLLFYRPFDDRRVGIPVYLMQCSSGCNWRDKLHTPRLEMWTRIIQFVAKPKKAFATPFAFLDREFVNTCNLVDGLLLDRYRLLAAGDGKPDWLPAELANRLIAWSEPRIAALPQMDG